MLAEHLAHVVEVSLANTKAALLHNVMYISIEHYYYCYYSSNYKIKNVYFLQRMCSAVSTQLVAYME